MENKKGQKQTNNKTKKMKDNGMNSDFLFLFKFLIKH